MNTKILDLPLLTALDALIAEKSVSRAAVRLHLSQPAVSSQLKRLREIFGDPLLYRSGREMLPTLRAQELSAEIKQVLATVDRLAQPSSFDPALSPSTFTLAATDQMELTLLPTIVRHIKNKAPSVKLAVSPLNIGSVAKQMERGEVDVCFTARTNAPPDLHPRALYKDRTVCIARKNHPKIGKRMTLEKFCQLEHVTITPNQLTTEVDRFLATKGMRRTVCLTVPHFFMLPEIVAATDMIAMIPRRLASRFSKKLTILESPLGSEIGNFEVTLLWHERTHRDPAHIWFRGAVSDAITKHAPF